MLLRRSCSSLAPLGIQRVGVIGLGLMGHGIVQVAAEKGFEVVAVESQVGARLLAFASGCDRPHCVPTGPLPRERDEED